MAGLLLKELKARGLIRRTLIVTPANLTFQWQRELADKFREKFDIIRRELGTDQVFDVVGEVFPSNLLEKLFRDMYARLTDEHKIQDRIVRDVSPSRFRAITESALEGLAKKELNLSAIVGRSAEAKERRLVPEVIEQFFVGAAPESGLQPRATAPNGHVYRVGRVPRNLFPIGDRQEARFGRLGRDYGKIVFDKALVPTDPTLERVLQPRRQTPRLGGWNLQQAWRGEGVGRGHGASRPHPQGAHRPRHQRVLQFRRQASRLGQL